MATATLPKTAAGVRRDRAYDNYFFSAMALLILATVFVGFARTYYLAGIFRAHLPALIIHIHGAVFSSWILLLITQTALVSVHRVDVHRKLGLYGFLLACLMVALGILAATNALSRNFAPPGSGFDPRTFYAIPIGGMVMFASLIYFAYRLRNDPAAHKRLILIATFTMLDAPAGRPPFAAITAHPLMDNIFGWLFLLMLLVYDRWSIGKLHRASIWGGLFLVIAGELRVPIGMTAPWLAFVGWIQHWAK